jgi:hypothetical protein
MRRNVTVTNYVVVRLAKPDAMAFAWPSDVDGVAHVNDRPGTLERRRD